MRRRACLHAAERREDTFPPRSLISRATGQVNALESAVTISFALQVLLDLERLQLGRQRLAADAHVPDPAVTCRATNLKDAEFMQ